jgi:hypothetical protein
MKFTKIIWTENQDINTGIRVHCKKKNKRDFSLPNPISSPNLVILRHDLH